MKDNNFEALAAVGLGKHKEFRPPTWKHRARPILGYSGPCAAAHPMRAAGGEVVRDTLGRLRGVGVTVVMTLRPRVFQVFEHAGAQWLLKHRVREETRDAYNQSTYIPFKIKCALLDERQRETQFGFTGRDDGVNRSPKTAGLAGALDVPPDTDNGKYPLRRASSDPMAEACRLQMLEAVRATYEVSRPTQRKRLRAGPSPSDYLLEGPYYWVEPAGGVYLKPQHWLPNGPWLRWVDDEFRDDWGTVLDPSGWEPREPVVGRRAWVPGSLPVDERALAEVVPGKRLDLNEPALRGRVGASFALMGADERTALCALWEPAAPFLETPGRVQRAVAAVHYARRFAASADLGKHGHHLPAAVVPERGAERGERLPANAPVGAGTAIDGTLPWAPVLPVIPYQVTPAAPSFDLRAAAGAAVPSMRHTAVPLLSLDWRRR